MWGDFTPGQQNQLLKGYEAMGAETGTGKGFTEYLGGQSIGVGQAKWGDIPLKQQNQLLKGYNAAGAEAGVGKDFNSYLRDQGLDVGNPGGINNDSTLGVSNSTWGAVSDIASIGTGLAGAYLGNKQLNLAQDKFDFDKDMMQKQYGMAKDAYDKQVKRAAGIGAQMQAGKVT